MQRNLSRGYTTSYTYGAVGNLTKVTPPTVTTGTQPQPTVITYYTNGLAQVDTVTDGNGHEVQYSYDNDGRVTQENYHVGYPCVAATCVTIGYTADGQITSRTDPTGSYSYTYDALDRLKTETSTDTSLCPSPVGYSYDLSSNLTAWTCNGTTAGSYTYNNNNLVTGSATNGGSCSGTIVQPCVQDSYVANNDTRLYQMTFPNGDIETFGYDPAGHTTSVVTKTSGGTTLTDFGANYRNGLNDQNFVQSRTSSINGSTAVTATDAYGPGGRLTGVTDSGGDTNTWSYSYDTDGNLTSKNVNGAGAQTFTYNQADQITGAASPAFSYTPSYDAAGNQTGDGTGTTYAYNTFNQLDSITPHGGSAETLAATGTTNNNLVSDGSTSLVESTLLGTVGTSTSSTSQKILRDPTGRLVYLTTPTASYNYLVDTQGNIAAIATSSGTLTGYYTYDPYGAATITNLSGTITTANPFRYNAGYTTTSGPTHYGARYYTPTSSTWTQTDPNPATIAQPQQYDRYPYAGDNPTTNSDPSGRFDLGEILGGVATIVGADTMTALGLAAAAVFAPESLPEIVAASEPLDYVISGANAFGIGLIAAGAS